MNTKTIARNGTNYIVDETLSRYYPEGYTSWKVFQDQKILSDARKDLSVRRPEDETYREVILLGEDKSVEINFLVHDFTEYEGVNYALGVKESHHIAIPIN